MKHIISFLLFSLFSFLVINSCTCPTRSDIEHDFAIYLLKDFSIEIYDILETPLSGLELEDEPWLSSEDIEFYDFSTHCIYLKKPVKSLFDNTLDDIFFPHSWREKSFVVCADKKKIYKGGFLWCLSSRFASHIPHISDCYQFAFYPSDVLMIDWDPSSVIPEDIRCDDQVREALIDAGLFHAGIEVNLISVDVVENADTSTIKYKFEIINNDQENLYVIDPDIVGSSLFHWWTNGVILKNTETNKHFGSYLKQVTHLDPILRWEPEWFTKINSGESIEREIVLKGYERFPAGEYSCEFYYKGPRKIEKEDRYTAEGRYWLGKIRSNTIEISI